MKILTVFLIILFIFTACDKDKAKTDGDVITDADIVATDIDVEKPDKDIVKPDEQIDEDMPVTENDESEYPDEDGYPYYDDKGNIHFCNKGDVQTEKAPQCVTNLWKEDNQEFCTKYPDYDCCGYPCEMPNFKPWYKDGTNWMKDDIGICDRDMAPDNFNGGAYTIKWFNFSEGKLGFIVHALLDGSSSYVNNIRAMEYDLMTQKYRFIAPASLNISAYHKGRTLSTANRIPFGEPYRNYMLYSDESGRIVTVYPKGIRFISWEPVISDKWAFANIEERDEDPDQMKYAKIVEKTGLSYENLTWKWISLGEGLAYKPNIVDNRLAFYLDNFKGYICDLDKTPKSLDECRLVNRTVDGSIESLRYPVIDEENNNILYYSTVESINRIVKVDISSYPFKYENIDIDSSSLEYGTMGISISQVKGNYIVYGNIFYTKPGESDERTGKLCFYRVDKKKSYCSKPVTWIDAETGKKESRYDQSRAEFWGHYIAWQDSGLAYLFLRDMECYCDHNPEVCPYDDYIPNTECPKDINTGEHECIDADTESPDEDAM